MKLYLRAVYANKFTLFGFCMIPVLVVSFFLIPDAATEFVILLYLYMILFGVAAPLGLTLLAFETLFACKRTLAALRVDERRAEDFREKYTVTYCTRMGVQLADRIWNRQKNDG